MRRRLTGRALSFTAFVAVTGCQGRGVLAVDEDVTTADIAFDAEDAVDAMDTSDTIDATAAMDAPDAIDAMDRPPPHDAFPAGCPLAPYIAGAWNRVYRPSGGRYLNDHTLARGDDGTWHLYGITNTGDGMPQDEGTLLHASAGSLGGPWRDLPDILTRDSSVDEVVLWAPYVFRPSTSPSSPWSMLYWAGWSTEPDPARGLRMAGSADLDTWTRAPMQGDSHHRPTGGRDPFVLETPGGWLLYSVGVSEAGDGGSLAHGRILVSRSSDPTDPTSWSEPTVAIEDPEPNYTWGNLESPFVVATPCANYLFVTRTNEFSAYTDYTRTMVFASTDPMQFQWEPVTEIQAHAAEVVVDESGEMWITSAGWPAVIGEDNRGLSIARLAWTPGIGARD